MGADASDTTGPAGRPLSLQPTPDRRPEQRRPAAGAREKFWGKRRPVGQSGRILMGRGPGRPRGRNQLVASRAVGRDQLVNQSRSEGSDGRPDGLEPRPVGGRAGREEDRGADVPGSRPVGYRSDLFDLGARQTSGTAGRLAPVGWGGRTTGRPAETQPVGQWCWVGAVLDRDGGRGREGDQLVRSAGRRIGGRSDDQLVTGGGRVWPGAHDLRFTTSWSQERAPPQTRFLLLTRGGVDGRPTTWTTTSWSHPWGRSEPGTA